MNPGPDLPAISRTLGKPVRRLTWHDQTVRAVFTGNTIAAGCGETKAVAWGRLVELCSTRGEV